MSTVTVATGLQLAARLIPFRAAGSSRLTGDYAAVCTPASTLPEQFRDAQRERTAYYMSHHDGTQRCKPDHAPRYIVTSYGVPIAWVTLDGRTHFANLVPSGRTRTGALTDTGQDRAMYRHQDAVRASWPERFAMNNEGDPVRDATYGFLHTACREDATA